MGETGDFWVFAYGSLIWNPGFDPAETVRARLAGYRRSFCMSSVVYRGTPEAPGLVLALDAQGGMVCEGVGYRVGSGQAETVLTYLRERELVSSAYLEQEVTLALTDGRQVQAITYVIDRAHMQYQGRLDISTQARIIARAKGPAGSNRDYLVRTVESLRALGIDDPELDQLDSEVATLPGCTL
ncbi:gamma-glutamylcyclotransferase [Halovulum sp. GXIMD14793]